MTYHSRQPYQPTAMSDEIEGLLHNMTSVARLAQNTWAKGFAAAMKEATSNCSTIDLYKRRKLGPVLEVAAVLDDE